MTTTPENAAMPHVQVQSYAVRVPYPTSEYKLYTITVRRDYEGADSWEIVHPPSTHHSAELGEPERLLRADGTWGPRPQGATLAQTIDEESALRYPLDQALELARAAALELAPAWWSNEPDDSDEPEGTTEPHAHR